MSDAHVSKTVHDSLLGQNVVSNDEILDEGGIHGAGAGGGVLAPCRGWT